MSGLGPLDFLPLWLFLVFTVCVVCAAVEAGYRLGDFRRRSPEHEAEASAGAIVGATLGLLAFMLAFTFSFAASRFEARRQVVLDEANAIGTTYLRAGMLVEPQRGEIRKLLREYADVRIEGIRQGRIEDVLKRSDALHGQLWARAEAAAKQEPSPITALFVDSLNNLIDLHATRIHVGLRSRIPLSIWLSLYFVTFASMGAMGYQVGLSGKRRSFAALALVFTFSAVMWLIADLDRPGAGMLEVSQQATIDLANSMKSLP